MAVEIVIKITSDPKMLCVIRAAVAEVCKLAGFEHDDTTKIILAVDEACSNIMRHAYKGKTDQPITATVGIKSDMLEILLHDNGEPADVKKIKSRKLDEIKPGGLGVHIIKTVMDFIEYQNGTQDGNFLIMKKHIPKDKQLGTGHHH